MQHIGNATYTRDFLSFLLLQLVKYKTAGSRKKRVKRGQQAERITTRHSKRHSQNFSHIIFSENVITWSMSWKMGNSETSLTIRNCYIRSVENNGNKSADQLLVSQYATSVTQLVPRITLSTVQLKQEKNYCLILWQVFVRIIYVI